MTDKEVSDIRKKYFLSYFNKKAEFATIGSLTKEYNSNKSSISSIINFKSFKNPNDLEFAIDVLLDSDYLYSLYSKYNQFEVLFIEDADDLFLYDIVPHISEYYRHCRLIGEIKNRKLYKQIFDIVFIKELR